MSTELLDIISGLFGRDLDLPLQTIFLSLDPVSLKRCRLVCQQWADFIKNRVWGSEKGTQPYEAMRNRLHYQWRHATPAARALQLDEDINCVSCDDSIVVCGMKTGIAKVYNIDNFNPIKDLDCNPTQSYAGAFLSQITSRSTKADVQSDIGKDVVASITDKGDVSVWRRKDWSNVYKKSHHQNKEVYAVKVLSNMIITGGCDGRLAILSWNGVQVELVRMLGEDPPVPIPTFKTPMKNPWHITHLDSNGEWVLVATSMCLKVWSLRTNTLVKSIDTEWTNSLVLSYPFGVIAQNEKRLTVLNLETGEEVRRVDTNMFWQVHHNGSLLVGSTPNFPWETSNRQSVSVHNLKEIIGQVKKEDVWNRRKYLASGQKMPSSCVNTSCLFTAQGSLLAMWDFWNCDAYNDIDSWARSSP